MLYIADQDHQIWETVVDHSSKFEDVYLIINPINISYNTGNQTAPQELPEKPQEKGKSGASRGNVFNRKLSKDHSYLKILVPYLDNPPEKLYP